MRTMLILPFFVLALPCAPSLAASAEPTIPAGTPVIRVQSAMAAPGWAVKERELLELNARALALFEKAYLAPDGTVRTQYEHGGGVLAPDDVCEAIYKYPLLYALGADDATWQTWWRFWRASITQCSENGLFANEFCKYMDWHHNGEQYEGFFLAALCAPDDLEYRRQALKFASFYDGSNPGVPNYDPKHRMIRSMLNGGAGPILRPIRDDWCQGGGEFWDAWLDCGHDGPVNLVTTCFGANAFMLTRDERYRRTTLDYIDAWRDRARRNGGIIPSRVNPDGTVPVDWTGGVMGWDFKPFGGVFQVSSGPRAAWGNALLMTGDNSYYDETRTLVDELWAHRLLDKEGKVVSVPRYRNKDGWYGSLNEPPANGIYASLLANLYLATMRKDDLQRVLERPLSGMCGHAHVHEGGYEPDWFRYLAGENPAWPESALDGCLRNIRADIAALEKMTDGKEHKVSEIRQIGWAGPLVNLMTGGVMPLWHGQLHLARFRYFDPERRRPGIPQDCAALVESMSDTGATLVLVNTGAEARTVLIQAGAYAEHRFQAVQPDGSRKRVLRGTHVAVVLSPGCGRRLTFTMKRYVATPSLALPWKKGR